jgi:Flp pilus assembly protein TadB
VSAPLGADRPRPKPLVLLSNVLLVAGVLLLIAWPIAGNAAFGVVGIALVVFAVIFALANGVLRSRRRRKARS